MTQIQPIQVPTKGEGNLFQITALNFPMNPTSVSFYWNVSNQQVDANDVTTTQTILEGNLTMDETTYQQWGDNDEYVINWACEQLGFTIIS